MDMRIKDITNGYNSFAVSVSICDEFEKQKSRSDEMDNESKSNNNNVDQNNNNITYGEFFNNSTEQQSSEIILANTPLYQSKHLQIHIGTSLFDIRNVDCIATFINQTFKLTESRHCRDVLDKCGADIQRQLDVYFQSNRNHELSYDKPTFPICYTSCGQFQFASSLAHLHLQTYDFTKPEWTRHHFKHTLKSLFIETFVTGFHSLDTFVTDIRTLALPPFPLYPTSKVGKWLKETLDEFLVQYPNINPQLHLVVRSPVICEYFLRGFVQNELKIPNTVLISTPTDQFYLLWLDKINEEFNTTLNHFRLTMPVAQIISIYKVHNEHLKYMYNKSSEVLAKRNPVDTINEYYLFHGTTDGSIDSICKFGFNRSYCGKNGVLFGKGVYFAKNASYSHEYSSVGVGVRASNGSKKFKMILAKVLVGQYETGKKDKVDPSIRPDGNQYDSTVDNVLMPSIFVVYRDYRAYPSYIIEYEI